MSEPTIQVYEVEDRTFPPSEEFTANALTCDSELYDEANADFEAFWGAGRHPHGHLCRAADRRQEVRECVEGSRP